MDLLPLTETHRDTMGHSLGMSLEIRDPEDRNLRGDVQGVPSVAVWGGLCTPQNVHQRIGAEYHLPLVCRHKSFVFVLVILIILLIIINNPTMIHVTHQCNRSVATLRCTAKVAAPTSKSKKPRGSFGPRGAVANAARAWQLGRSATTNGTRGSKWGTRWDVPSW